MRRATLAWLLLLGGCGTPWVETEIGDWRRLTTTARSNNAGTLRVGFKPEPGETAMLFTVEPDDPTLGAHVRTLQVGSAVPFRADVEVTGDRAKTNAGFVGDVATLNWPVLASDGPLLPGSHKLGVGLADDALVYARGAARISVLLKRDEDLSRGMLRVNVVFAGSTGTDPGVVTATEEAVALWRQIYREIGIELEVGRFDHPGPGVLQAPGQGDAEVYQAIARTTGLGSLNLVIVEDIAGFADVFGFAGDIPGPLVPTGRSAVVVSAGMGAGPDGVFSPVEVQLYAETMAHEAGHYLGLFHPVETSFSSWDALDDTPECDRELSCIQALGANLMFPFPICDIQGCQPQVGLTEQQGEVANRYTGVL